MELGAEVIRSRFPGYDDTEEWAIREAERSGKAWISAFDDEAIMAGNGGSLALEILEDAPDARGFVLPVGGGGMSGGLAFAVKEKLSGATIVGCQHEASPALALSLERGHAVTRLPAVETAAGGIEGGIGRKTFEVLRSRIDRVALVSEREIFEGVRWMLEKHQHLIEPSAAAAVAACLTGKAGPFEGPLVVVISGRNVSLETLRKILSSLVFPIGDLRRRGLPVEGFEGSQDAGERRRRALLHGGRALVAASHDAPPSLARRRPESWKFLSGRRRREIIRSSTGSKERTR